MVLDRRTTHGLVQALLHARNKPHGGYARKNAVQTSMVPGDERYGEPTLGRIGFPSASQPGVTTGAAGQPRKSIQTPFRPLASLSYAGEAADTAKSRGIPALDLLSFKESPSTVSRRANPQTTYGWPLAVNGTAASQGGYWDSFWERLFPSYCAPTDDNLAFPPLINQVSEADKAACHEQHERDKKQCYENHSYKPDVLSGCLQRADTNRDLCLRGEKELSPWNDVDSDGIRLRKPRKRWKLK
jgi:hypothetical protein